MTQIKKPQRRVRRATLHRERQLVRSGHDHIAGTDEAGRGCLAGPVVAAAVVLNPFKPIKGLADSKLLPSETREELASVIKQNAIAYAIASCSPREIDRLNILWASMEAMRRAIESLKIDPTFVLIDGHIAVPGLHLECETIIKGDAKSSSIAAASILAKVERDRQMRTLHVDFPFYGWDTNVGYPTLEHFAGIRIHGPSRHHRYSFQLRLQGSLFSQEQKVDVEG